MALSPRPRLQQLAAASEAVGHEATLATVAAAGWAVDFPVVATALIQRTRQEAYPP
jgi:hypothetical protein